MEEKKIDVSIVILSYNSKTDLERLLPSIWTSENIGFNAGEVATARYSAEVIVVDNGSTDGTYNWLQAVSYKLKAIRNINNGFAKGNNLGIKIAKGKYLLILNPDTKLENDTLKIMLEFMEDHPEIGISTCKVILPNGKLDLACRRRFPNPWNSFLRIFKISNRDYNMLDTDENESQEIDACMGAFMFCRRAEQLQVTSDKLQVNASAGLTPVTSHLSLIAFDESYFMYGEDLDLCWRVKEEGFKVWYFPKTFITHFKGSSSRKTPFKALKWFHDAMWIFYKKHYSKKYPFVLNWLVFLAVYFRLTFLIAINFFKSSPQVSK